MIIALGHYVLAIPAGLTVYLGLVLVAVGTGLLKPNISTMVGELYDQLPEDEHHSQRDSGFSLFYLGINVGAWAGALVTGWLGVQLRLARRVRRGRGRDDPGADPVPGRRPVAGRRRAARAHRPLDEYRRA